ncbi:MAG: hypothetical protein ACJ72Z_10920 [Pyrinomonadaceae bacterium]
MYLDAARGETAADLALYNGNGNGNGHASESVVYSPWEKWEPSQISHHGKTCCEFAREWLLNIDLSALNGSSLYSGPRWLRQRFDWGPGVYPVHWCDVLKKKKLDCGIHAALAYEVFANRGIKCLRAQFVQEFSSDAGSQWRSNWEKDSAITAWIDESRIYHEGCAVSLAEGTIKIWDPSAGWWIDPKTTSGYGSLLAIRLSGRGQDQEFFWGPHRLKTGKWIPL